MFTSEQTETSLKIWLLLTFLTLYAILSAYLEHKHYSLHRSGVAIVTGIIVGFFIFITSPDTYNKIVKINQTLIFSVLLPPMLFCQGYNFKKNAFLKNFKYIAVFGILGTFISFTLTSGLIQAANELNMVRDFRDITKYRTLSVWEVLLLSACLCSIDTVASEEAVSEKKYQKINSIIVGEDVFKDTITIVLFRAILHLQEVQSPQKFIFYWYTSFLIILNFIILVLGSCTIGIVIALITTFFFKKFRFLLNDEGVSETTVMFLSGFSTYILTQMASFSGVIGILCYGVVLNRLNIYNLSEEGEKSAKTTFSCISIICEGLLFLIMGVMVWQVRWDNQSAQQEMSHSWTFILIVILIIFLVRAINIFVLYFVFSKIGKKFKMNKNELIILFVGGLVKGATPFALFTSVQIKDGEYARNEGLVMKSTIIIIVIITSVFLNSFISRIYKKPLNNLNQEAKQYLLDKQSKIKFIQKRKEKLRKCEDKLKPYLIYNYEDRKEEIQNHKNQLKRKHIQESLAQFDDIEENDLKIQSDE